MAASLLLPSPTYINRKEQERFYIYSNHLQKSVVYFSFQLQCSKCTIRPYNVPHGTVAHLSALRCFSTNGSVNLHGTHKEYGVLAPKNIQRSTTFSGLSRTQSQAIEPCSSSSTDAMNDFERQLQEFFDEVKTMLKTGNTNNAMDLLQANYEAVKEQMNAGAKGMEQAAMLDVIALSYMSIGDFKFVERLLEMLNEIVGNVKNDEPFVDSVLIHMGSMYTNLGKFEDAMLMYEKGLEILEGLFGRNSPFLITPLLGMAKVYASIGRASKAVEIYHRAITILETSRGAESADVVVPLSGLGNLFLKEGRAADAENSFNRILRVHTKLYGENDGRVGIAMCSLAHAKCAKGELDEAIQLYKKGLRVIGDSKYMALDDEIVEKIRIDLAELLHIAGREQEGRKLLEECLLINEKHKGNEHPSTVTHLLNLATSYSRSKNFVEAERLLRTCLQIMEKDVELQDQSITVPMLHLAVALYHLKQDEEAEHLAREVVRIREEAFGNESLIVGEALDCLVSIQTRLGKDDGVVVALLKRVLSIQEKELGLESEEVMITLKKLVFYLDKMGRRDEKLLLQRRLSKLRTKYKHRVQS